MSEYCANPYLAENSSKDSSSWPIAALAHLEEELKLLTPPKATMAGAAAEAKTGAEALDRAE